MILHRAVMQQNRTIAEIRAAEALADDAVAQGYEAWFEELDWGENRESAQDGRRPGRLGQPRRAYLRSFLVMVEEKIETMPDLRAFLVRHPALVWGVEYRLVSAPHR